MDTHYLCSMEQTGRMQRNSINSRQLSWFILLMLFSCATKVEAQIYQWVDKSGVIHFGQAPPQDAGVATKMEPIAPSRNVKADSVPSHMELEKKQRVEKVPQVVEEPVPMAHQQVAAEMYSTSWCGYCRKAREYFRARGIPLVEYDIEADLDAAERKRQIDTRPGVPLVVINGQMIHGYAPAMYEQALASRR